MAEVTRRIQFWFYVDNKSDEYSHHGLTKIYFRHCETQRRILNAICKLKFLYKF